MRGRGPWWKERFNEHNVRMTTSREVVLEVLNDTAEHLSASDIYVKAHAVRPDIGLTTVYRALEILEQMGIVQKFDFGDGRSRYELINSPDRKDLHHHHLVCVKCRKIINYTDFIKDELELIRNTQSKLSEKYDFDITGHVVNFYGICRDCRI